LSRGKKKKKQEKGRKRKKKKEEEKGRKKMKKQEKISGHYRGRYIAKPMSCATISPSPFYRSLAQKAGLRSRPLREKFPNNKTFQMVISS